MVRDIRQNTLAYYDKVLIIYQNFKKIIPFLWRQWPNYLMALLVNNSEMEALLSRYITDIYQKIRTLATNHCRHIKILGLS